MGNIQNSKTWQKIAAVPVFACCHSNERIQELGDEVLWRIYTFSPIVGEDILSNKMEKKKSKQVRKALGMEDYWSQQQQQRAAMQTIKLYNNQDAIPVKWQKLTYNPVTNEMSPARLWSMMQKVVYGEIDLLEEHPTMNYDDFVKGLTECQTYLRSASIRALFQCLPRKHRPFVTKQEFIDFICDAHGAPNRRHYALRIKELLTIIEDKWKTEEVEKKRIAEKKQFEREQERIKRKEERERKKREKAEKRRQKEVARKEREQARKEKALKKQEEERQKMLEQERQEKENEIERKKRERQEKKEQKRRERRERKEREKK